MQNKESFPSTHAFYIKGSCFSAQDAINKIRKRQEEFGIGKYINFAGMPISDLPKVQQAFPHHVIKLCIGKYINFVEMAISDLPQVQQAFPDHVIENTAGQWTPYYELKPKIQN